MSLTHQALEASEETYRMRFVGSLIDRVGLPGLVRPFRYYDSATGQVVSVRTSPYYTTLTVGSKDLYSIRESGKYDGFGESVRDGDCKSDYAKE